MHEKWDDTPFYTPIDGKILNNDFFGGDLRGIIKKLDYLVSLNVGIIYLNPIFKAYSNHKYDTGNYFEIDPMFGTKEDFIELVSQAKKRNISIILDGVFNHTGSDSLYFNKDNNYISLGAYQSKDSPYYNWYKFKSFPDSYESWWGFSTLPALNDKNPDLVKFFTGENGVVDYWLKLGASGFRLDVVDELSESFLLEIVKRAKQTNPDALIVGEVWEDASNKIAYGSRRSYLNGEQLTSVMNYPLRDAILDYLQNHNSFAVRNCMRILTNNYPKQILDNLMNILSTHDTVRLLTAFSNVDFSYLSRDEQANFALSHEEYYLARQKLKMATAMLYTLPGLPTIYYGDEAGLQGFKDPFCRRCMPWDNIDKTIYEWYRVLGDIRKEDVLKDGEYSEDVCENGVFSFIRKKGNNQLITIINNSNYEYIYHLDLGYDIIEKVIIENVVTIPKLGVKIIKVVKDA